MSSFLQAFMLKRRHFIAFLRELTLTQPGCQSQSLADSCNSSSNDCGTVCMPPVSVLPTGRDTVQLCNITLEHRHAINAIHSSITNSEAFMYLNSKPTSNKCTHQTRNRPKNTTQSTLPLYNVSQPQYVGLLARHLNSCTAITLYKLTGHLIRLSLKKQQQISSLNPTHQEVKHTL